MPGSDDGAGGDGGDCTRATGTDAGSDAGDPSPGDHYRAGADGPLPAGVYRVVGADGGRVALLRVGDADGRRVHTGTVEHLDRAGLAALAPAENPASGGRIGGVSGLAEGLWLTLRYAPDHLAARRRQVGVGVALVAGSLVGRVLFPAYPADFFVVLSALGVLALAAAVAGLPRSGG